MAENLSSEYEQYADWKAPDQENKQEIVIPELVVDPHAPELTPHKRHILEQQWEKFWKLRSADNPASSDIEPKLGTGFLLHQMQYRDQLLESILASGVLSGELGYTQKETIPEDMETHYCADFFVNTENRSIADYLAYAHQKVSKPGSSLQLQRPERYACPNDRNDNIAIVVDPAQPGLDQLLEYSNNSFDTSKLEGFINQLPVNEGNEDKASKLKAVLVGVPANYINYIIIGGGISNNPEVLSTVRNIVNRSGLKIKILNTQGAVLNQDQNADTLNQADQLAITDIRERMQNL